MRKFFLIFLVLPFAFNCSNKNELPEGILPRKKMQEVMWDMIRAGEFLNGFVFNKDTTIDKIAESQKWYDKIYTMHKVSKKDFDRSYAYYQEHPVLMKELLDSLSKIQVQVRQRYGQSPYAKADSLTKKNLIPSDETRKRLFDTVNKRKKIIKKASPVK